MVALSLASSSAEGHALAGDIVLCSYFLLPTLTVPLHPGVQMGSGELNARGNAAMDSHPIQGQVEILLHATETGISFSLMCHLACMQT